MNATSGILSGAAVTTRAYVGFDGQCVSHSLTLPDGTRKSVRVILPSALAFDTGAPEIMGGDSGYGGVLQPHQAKWRRCGPGERFAVPGTAHVQFRVDGERHHDICHFG
ncbi:MAG: pyrimidine/purine nucleoside phosphorylase [Tepidimonas sp.]|uniref:pyrimidine/purine nucleoside phosphorylase n=1 Tax=Tepidimonas sp. TaxID=2002775 RepID=UPI0040550DCC